MKLAAAALAVCALTLTSRPCAAGQAGAVPRAAPSVPADRRLVERYCVGCHNSRALIAGLDLASLDLDNPAAHAQTWEKVVRKLRTGAMPPPGLPRPDDAAYDSLASSLERAL